MANFKCVLCESEVPRSDYEAHVNEKHSDPELHSRDIDGAAQMITDADYVRIMMGKEADAPGQVAEDVTEIPSASIFDELGVKASDFGSIADTVEAGAACSHTEAKRVMDAVSDFVGFRIHRAAFLVQFVSWGIRTSFSEEVKDAGGFDIITHPTVKSQSVFKTVEALQIAIAAALAKKTGRVFTFRRFARYIAPMIPQIIDNNPDLQRYKVTGSPISNRLGVPPQDFLAVTSIFEYIKPLCNWTVNERDAFNAHNRSVRKFASGADTSFRPQDLRPSPSEASTLNDQQDTDFMRRHRSSDRGSFNKPNYGIGGAIFDDMLNSGQNDRRGIGYRN